MQYKLRPSLTLTYFVQHRAESRTIQCFRGTAVYDNTNRNQFLLELGDDGTRIEECNAGKICGQYSWVNTDNDNNVGMLQLKT